MNFLEKLFGKKLFGPKETPALPPELTYTEAPRDRVRHPWKGWRRRSRRDRIPLGPNARRRRDRTEFLNRTRLDAIEIARERREAQLKDRLEGGHAHMQEFRRRQRNF
jgi:hypothetical protein